MLVVVIDEGALVEGPASAHLPLVLRRPDRLCGRRREARGKREGRAREERGKSEKRGEGEEWKGKSERGEESGGIGGVE